MVIDLGGDQVEFRWRLVGAIPQGSYAPGILGSAEQKLEDLNTRVLRIQHSLTIGELTAQDAERALWFIDRERQVLDPDGDGIAKPYVEVLNGASSVVFEDLVFDKEQMLIRFGDGGGKLPLSPQRTSLPLEYPGGEWVTSSSGTEQHFAVTASQRALNSIESLSNAGIEVPEQYRGVIRNFSGVPISYSIRDQLDGVWSYSSMAYGEAQIEIRVITTDSCDRRDGTSANHAIALARMTPEQGDPLDFAGPVHWIDCGHVDSGVVQIQLSRFDGQVATSITLELNDDQSMTLDTESTRYPGEQTRIHRIGHAPFPERLAQIPESAPMPHDQDILDYSGHASLFHETIMNRCKDANVLLVYDPACDRTQDAMERIANFERQFGDDFGVFVLSIGQYTGTRHGGRKADEATTRAIEEGWPCFYSDVFFPTRPSSGALPAMDRVHALPAFIFFDGQGRVEAVYCGLSDYAIGEPYFAQLRHLKEIIQRMVEEKP